MITNRISECNGVGRWLDEILSMETEIACHECGNHVAIELAYHRRNQGFRCQSCQEKYQRSQWVVFFIVLFFGVVLPWASHHNRISGNGPRKEIGLSGGHVTESGSIIDYSVELAVAEDLPTGVEDYPLDWQDQIPVKIVDDLKYCAGYVHNVVFDCEEALALPGAIIENNNQSIVIHLRSPDGRHQFKFECKSDDLASIIGETERQLPKSKH